jgi:hypothetical protein
VGGGEEEGAGQTDPLDRRPPPPRERPFAAPATPHHCSLSLPSQLSCLQHHNLSFSRSLLLSLSFLVSGGADATAQAYLAMWALYMGNKVGKGANGVSLSLLQREVEAR